MFTYIGEVPHLCIQKWASAVEEIAAVLQEGGEQVNTGYVQV